MIINGMIRISNTAKITHQYDIKREWLMKKWAGFILVLALLLLTTAAMAADLTIVTQSGTAASLSDNVWTLLGGTYTVSGSTKTESIVVTGTSKVTLNGVTIDMDESGTVIPTVSALTVRNGSVELVVKGSNVLRGVCGIQLFNSKSSVTMTGDGRITAVGSAGAGIGSRQNGPGGNITIGGTMTVWAYCAQSDAAIGAGASGSIGNISIKDNPVINARSPYEYSDNNKYVKPMTGIGSGWKGKAGNISISGGTVNAYGANGGAAIGTGLNASVGSITITGSSVVTAIATKGQLFNADGYVNTASYGMAGIGDGQLGHMTGDITIDQNSDGSVVAWGA